MWTNDRGRIRKDREKEGEGFEWEIDCGAARANRCPYGATTTTRYIFVALFPPNVHYSDKTTQDE